MVKETGSTMSDIQAAATTKGDGADIEFRCVCLTAPRADLFRDIDARAEQIIARGLVEETVQLLGRGLVLAPSVTSALGYRQAMDYVTEHWLRKRWTSPQSHRRALVRLVRQYQAVTRQFARRQMTWFRQSPQYTWLDAAELHAPETDEHSRDVAREQILEQLAAIATVREENGFVP